MPLQGVDEDDSQTGKNGEHEPNYARLILKRQSDVHAVDAGQEIERQERDRECGQDRNQLVDAAIDQRFDGYMKPIHRFFVGFHDRPHIA